MHYQQQELKSSYIFLFGTTIKAVKAARYHKKYDTRNDLKVISLTQSWFRVYNLCKKIKLNRHQF